jgi:phospholipase/carboxylesterase
VTGAAPVGLQPLMLGAARDSYMYVPVGYQTERSAPLVLLLHGAGGHAQQGLELLRNLADTTGIILLAPASRERTWDLLVDRRYGPDATMIDQALEQTFSRYAVDPARLAIGGFSDGASYALSLGITNGDLFTHVIALLAGVHGTGRAEGEPARLRLSRHPRRGAADQPLQPQDCAPTKALRLRGALPGVRRGPHDPAGDRARGGPLVYAA